MGYGVNSPNGFTPKGYTLGSLPSSGLASKNLFRFQINSGYGQNIGLGDPVFWLAVAASSSTKGNGYIVAGPDAAGAVIASNVCSIVNSTMVGVFAGCQYNSNSEVLPDAPMKLSWRAGTVTADGLPATAFIIPATYQAGFSVQTDVYGCQQAGLLQMATIQIPVDGSNIVTLNEDASQAYITMGTNGVGQPYLPGTATTLQVIGFDDVVSGTAQTGSQVGLAYGNVITRIAASPFPNYSIASGF